MSPDRGSGRRAWRLPVAVILGVMTLGAPTVAQSPGTPAGAWDTTQTIGTDSPTLTLVGCGSTSMCQAVDQGGHAYAFDGTSWAGSTDITSANWVGLECPTASSCMLASLQGTYLLFDGTHWGEEATVTKDDALAHDLSCASPTFCVLVGDAGMAYAWDGSGWSAGTLIDPVVQQAAAAVNAGTAYDLIDMWVGCPAVGSCAAVDSAGNVTTLAGGSWSALAPLVAEDPSTAIQGIDCAPGSPCIVSRHGGTYVVGDGSTWSPPMAGPSPVGLTPFSCATATFCMAVPGYWSVFDGSAWLQAPFDAPGPSDPLALDCPTAGFCASVGAYGATDLFHG